MNEWECCWVVQAVGECSIRVGNLQSRDAGNWTCLRDTNIHPNINPVQYGRVQYSLLSQVQYRCLKVVSNEMNRG